jgi:hypothetical protein
MSQKKRLELEEHSTYLSKSLYTQRTKQFIDDLLQYVQGFKVSQNAALQKTKAEKLIVIFHSNHRA